MSTEQIDFAAEGLLDGLDGTARDERLALLETLAAEGVSLAELRRTTASGTVIFLPADRVIVGDQRFTAQEVSELSGVELDFLEAVRRAMGLPVPEPDESIYTDDDVQAAKRIVIGREAGIPDEETLDL